MKITESQSAALSNHEVLEHIKAVKARPRSTPQRSQNTETVLKELHDYLSPSPSAQIPAPLPPYASSTQYSKTTFQDLMQRLKPFKLTKAEMLMIVNLRPSDPILLDCVVVDLEDRFSEEQQEEILSIIGSTLGKEADGANGGANGDAMQTNG